MCSLRHQAYSLDASILLQKHHLPVLNNPTGRASLIEGNIFFDNRDTLDWPYASGLLSGSANACLIRNNVIVPAWRNVI